MATALGTTLDPYRAATDRDPVRGRSDGEKEHNGAGIRFESGETT